MQIFIFYFNRMYHASSKFVQQPQEFSPRAILVPSTRTLKQFVPRAHYLSQAGSEKQQLFLQGFCCFALSPNSLPQWEDKAGLGLFRR
jgi:hypothetical protein